jgi:hypothetical protein
MNSKFANQIQLSTHFDLTTDAIAAIGDSVETAVGKLQAQNFAAGVGTYISGWAADTNTPTLLNSTIEAAGNWYNCTAPGTVDFGAGGIAFALNDRCYSNGTTYQKGDAITSDVLLADANLLIGQANGIGSGMAITGAVSIANTGAVTLSFTNRLTAGTFDGTLVGGGVQYFNTAINVDIGDTVLGIPYYLYNSHSTDIVAFTITGSGAAVIGGDAMLVGLVQSLNPGTGCTITLQNATTVLID